MNSVRETLVVGHVAKKFPCRVRNLQFSRAHQGTSVLIQLYAGSRKINTCIQHISTQTKCWILSAAQPAYLSADLIFLRTQKLNSVPCLSLEKGRVQVAAKVS
jgi:hypothetical protein